MGCVIYQLVAVAMGILPYPKHSYVAPSSFATDTQDIPSLQPQLIHSIEENAGIEAGSPSALFEGMGLVLMAFGGHSLTP